MAFTSEKAAVAALKDKIDSIAELDTRLLKKQWQETGEPEDLYPKPFPQPFPI
jgi:hypothetical protein